MFSGLSAGFLKVAAIAVVAGGLAGGGIYWAVQVGGSEDGSAFGQTEPSVTVTITLEDTAAPTPTATALPPTATVPLPTEPPPTLAPPVPTADTRVSMGPPRADLIQLGKDGKYFVADRGDGCMWVEYLRDTSPEIGLQVFLGTDCPADFAITFRPESGLVLPLVP